MANLDNPFGLRPVRHLNGMPWNGQTQRCLMASGVAVNAYVGDAVVRAGTSNVDGTCPTITIATMGDANPVYGVITGFEPDGNYPNQVYRTTATNRYCYVCIDPDVIYHIQDDGVAVIGITGSALSANLIQTHAGSTVSGRSQMELKADTVAANASFQLFILNAAPIEGNDATIARAIWEVLISQHQLRTAIATGGILGIA